MAAPMVRTSVPGVYKRGSRYVVVYTAGGKQRKESARTLAEARKLKAVRQADVARGEFQAASKLTFKEYATEWIERYAGKGKGFRESTRDDYRRDLALYAFPFFHDRHRRRLTEITPRDIANFVGWLADDQAQADHEHQLRKWAEQDWMTRRRAEQQAAGREGRRVREERRPPRPNRREAKRLSESRIRSILNPVRACLGTAVEEDLIRRTPASRVSIPRRRVPGEPGVRKARALSREQLATILELVHPSHRLLFAFLASTGLRIGEAIGLQWKHLHLDGSEPHVDVQREIYRGRVDLPKTEAGVRQVPLHHDLVLELRSARAESAWPGDEDPVFASRRGTPLSPDNLRRRVLAPVAEEVGVPWAGFHAFRHTFASLMFERGANPKQVQRALGHGSLKVTLDVYTHLLSDRLDEPLDLAAELGVATKTATDPTAHTRNGSDGRPDGFGLDSGIAGLAGTLP
ncbi:MAG: site-specific integrase [Thermoleophilaceae bacterium]|nr:site-specific integrase [Thermoleophilaceae bacterium]